MSSTIIPLKIYFPKRGFQIGVAAKSLQHLRDTLQAKMGLSSSFKLTLDDGTIVCDPEYFKLLERQTKLNVIEAALLSKKTTANATEATVARKRMSPSTPTEASKRARLSPESRDGDQKDLNTNQNNSQLLSKICISSVAGNVPMSVSPKPASEHPRPSTAVQQPRQLQNIAPQPQNIVPQPQAQPISPPPQLQCTQTQTIIRSPPPAQQVQNGQLSQQQLHRKPAAAAPRPGPIMLSQHPHPQIQPSIPSPMILTRPRGPSYPHQIIFPSNQPHAFPGHPPMPLTAPPIMTPSTIQWIPHGTGRYPPPQGVIPPSYQQGPRVLYPHPVPISPPPHPDILAYQPGPPQQPTQERICQMQVERQMKTVIRMTPPPNPSQTPLPRPVQPQIRPAPVVPQTQPLAVIQSPVRGPNYPVQVQVQPALRPSTTLPDGTHIVQQVVELLRAPEPTLIPSTPPALLKVISSKLPTDSRHTSSTPNPPPSTDLSNSTDASGLSAPARVSDHSEPASIQGRQVTPAEDTDCEDEHALQIVIGESEKLPQPSTPPPPPPPAPRLSSSPCALSSPQSRASSSPCSSPVVAATQKSRKPTELNLLSTQIDDGYCSATASSLGSADDVKRALPFASFDDYIPLHNCYADSKEDKQDSDAIESTVPQDKCEITNPKDDRTDEHEQQDVNTQTTSSADFEDKTLVVEIPIKIVDGQIYYNNNGVLVKEEPGVGRQEVKVESDLGRQDVQEEETDLGREEIIFLDSEADDNDSDVCPLDQYINQGTPSNSFHLSLDEETSEMDTDVESDRTVESRGDIDEKQVVVADHGGEVPVVTTPLDCTVAFKCVSDLMDIIGSKDKQNADSNIESRARATSALCNNDTTFHFDGEGSTCIVEESVLLDSSNLHDEGLLSDELVMGNEVVVSLEGSSQQAFDYMDSSELISNLLLHSCLPQNGRPVSLS